MMSIQSRCRRTARFWWAAVSWRTASADRRATASPGSMPPPAWQIRSTRTRTVRSMSIAVQADGKILAGGIFTNSIGGQTRNHIARLDADDWPGRFVQPERERYRPFNRGAGGRQDFSGRLLSPASAGRRAIYIARLDATTGLADSFNPNANSQCRFNRGAGGRQDFSGRLFHGANSIGGQTRNRIARLDATTGLADSFDPDANSIVDSIAVQADGKILAGGVFSEQHRRTDAQPHRPARCRDRLGGFVRPEREQLLSMPSRCRRTARF